MAVSREIELRRLTRGEAQQYDIVQLAQEGQQPQEEEEEEEQHQQQLQRPQHQDFQFLLQLVRQVDQQYEEGDDLESANRMMTQNLQLMRERLRHFHDNRQVMIATKGPIKSIATEADFSRQKTPKEIFEEERLRQLREKVTRVANELLDYITAIILQWMEINLQNQAQCAKYFEVLLKVVLSSQRDQHEAVENAPEQEVETFKVPILRLCAAFLELAKSNYELELACVFHDLSIIVVRLEEAKVPELLQKKFAAKSQLYAVDLQFFFSAGIAIIIPQGIGASSHTWSPGFVYRTVPTVEAPRSPLGPFWCII